MEATIKDKDKNIIKALHLVGFIMESKDLEMILNVADFVSKKGDKTSIKDISELECLVKGLYTDIPQ